MIPTKQVVFFAMWMVLLLFHRGQAFTTSPLHTIAGRCPPKISSSSFSKQQQQQRASSAPASVVIQNAWPSNRDPKGVAPDYPRTKSRLAITVIATLVTWRAHNAGLCSSVLASSAATLAASLWSPGLGQAAFCGSFAGMSSIGVLVGWKETLLAGSLTAALFEVLIHRNGLWLGLGGRLGFLAFIAVNMVACISGVPAFPSPGKISSVGSWIQAATSAPLVAGAIFGALGSVATIVLREYAEGESNDMSDPVRASAVVGILAALLVGVCDKYTNFAMLMAFGGSFTGMSLPLRLCKGVIPGRKKRSQPWVSSIIACFAAAGAIGGIIHAASIGVNWWSTPAGWGGKAGASAFAGVLIFRAIEKIIYAIRIQIWGKEVVTYPEIY